MPLLSPVLAILKPIRRDIGSIFIQVHPDTVTYWFQELARKCSINARPQDLRHSAATHMLNSGIPIEIVQKVLGRVQIQTTQIYAEVLQKTLHKEMKKLRFDL